MSPLTTAREAQEIMTTTDESLLRKLHAMRAARSVFVHEGRRWVITRIVPGDDASWMVYGTRARRV